MAANDPEGPPASRSRRTVTVLADSNLVIYASKPDARGDTALAFIERRAPLVSAVSRVEALGYHS